MQRTIVVGVHDTPRSKRALDKACEIAADFNADLVIVGAYEALSRRDRDNASNALDAESCVVEGSFGIENVLRDAEKRAWSMGARVADVVIVNGEPMKGLLEVADRSGANIIVMGNHQMTGPVAQLVGSISDQVSRKTPTHVLMVQ